MYFTGFADEAAEGEGQKATRLVGNILTRNRRVILQLA